MKVSQIVENVIDFTPRVERKRSKEQEKAVQAKSQAMINVDHAIATTIDQLKRQGMTEYDAYQAVMDHLSDVVMAFDMQGGTTD